MDDSIRCFISSGRGIGPSVEDRGGIADAHLPASGAAGERIGAGRMEQAARALGSARPGRFSAGFPNRPPRYTLESLEVLTGVRQ
jgi:hypothetical protein